jgi:hypothetical protein
MIYWPLLKTFWGIILGDLQRVELKYDARSGMISPARYIDAGCDRAEAEKTIIKIQKIADASANDKAFTVRAAFVSLLGDWQAKKKGYSNLVANFYPRLLNLVAASYSSNFFR